MDEEGIGKAPSKNVNSKFWMASGNAPFKTISVLTTASNKPANLPKT